MWRVLTVLLLGVLGTLPLVAQPLYFYGRMGVGQLLGGWTEGLWRPTAGLGMGLETPWPISVESYVGGFTIRWQPSGGTPITYWLSDVLPPSYGGRIWQLQLNLALRIRLLRYKRSELALGIGPSLRYIRRRLVSEDARLRCLSPYYEENNCVYWPQKITSQGWETAGHMFLEAGLYPLIAQWGMGIFLESAAFSEGSFMVIGLRVVRR